ncbi:hypothetical protein Trydic_g6649 [Trypoxylus dichotomus]
MAVVAHKGKDIYTFADLATAFEWTFLKSEGLLLKWKGMTELVQCKGESLNQYFHEKIRRCTDLCLTFDDTKEQVLIGLYDRNMCSAMLSRTHRDSDDLFHDLVEFERINLARIERNKDKKKICRNDDPVTEPKGNNQVNTEAKPQGRLPERRSGDNKPLCFKCGKYGHVAKYCIHGKIIYYTCKKGGRISKNCPGETKENLSIDHLIEHVDQNAKYFKEARINGHMVRQRL